MTRIFILTDKNQNTLEAKVKPAIDKIIVALSFSLMTPVQASPLLFFCDGQNNQFVVESQGGFDDEGVSEFSCEKELLSKAKIPYELYEPWKHITMLDDDHIKSVSKFHTKCKIEGIEYIISLEPRPGNFNIQGRCGAAFGAQVEIHTESKKIAQASFGDVDSCWQDAQLAVRNLRIGGGEQAVSIGSTPFEDRYFPDISQHGAWQQVSPLDLVTYKACRHGTSTLWRYALEAEDEEALDLLISNAKETGNWESAAYVAQEIAGPLTDKLVANLPPMEAAMYRAYTNSYGHFSIWEYAILKNDQEAFGLFLAEARRTGYWGDALLSATKHGSPDTLELLLRNGANPNVRSPYKPALQEAVCMPGGRALVELLLKYGAKNSNGDLGEDALFDAIICNNMWAVEKLSKSGGFLDLRNINTLFHLADDDNLAEAFNVFISHGHDVNMNVEVKRLQVKDIKIDPSGALVIETGAEPSLVTFKQSMIDLAIHHNKPKLLEVLQSAKARR